MEWRVQALFSEDAILDMSYVRFTKFFLLALGFQIALQLIVSPLLSTLFADGKKFPDFLDLFVYAPFINGVIRLGGYEGESSMIWPPVFGIALGILIYSALFGLILAYVKRSKENILK